MPFFLSLDGEMDRAGIEERGREETNGWLDGSHNAEKSERAANGERRRRSLACQLSSLLNFGIA